MIAKRASRRLRAHQREAVYERDGGVCHLCQKPVDPNAFHVDHITPYSRGGSSDFDNLALAHPVCNISKHNRTPEEVENGTPSRRVRGVMLDGSNDGGVTMLVRLPPHLNQCLERMADQVGIDRENVIRIAVLELAKKWGAWQPPAGGARL